MLCQKCKRDMANGSAQHDEANCLRAQVAILESQFTEGYLYPPGAERDETLAAIETVEAALQFYADGGNYMPTSGPSCTKFAPAVESDEGERARDALAALSGDAGRAMLAERDELRAKVEQVAAVCDTAADLASIVAERHHGKITPLPHPSLSAQERARIAPWILEPWRRLEKALAAAGIPIPAARLWGLKEHR